MFTSPRPLQNRAQVIARLLELTRAQLELEGRKFAEQEVTQSTPFQSLDLPLLAWVDLSTDIIAEWGLSEDDLPEEPDADLTPARLADALLRLTPPHSRAQAPSVEDQSRPSRKGHHNKKKKQ